MVWRLVRGVLQASIALALVACGPAGDAREQQVHGVVGEVALADLPREARDTLMLIRKGGPFSYRKDGSTFGNREGHLPRRPRGYYTEYTVRTPLGARPRRTTHRRRQGRQRRSRHRRRVLLHRRSLQLVSTDTRMSPTHGRPKAGDVPRGGTARSAREQAPAPTHGWPTAREDSRGRAPGTREHA